MPLNAQQLARLSHLLAQALDLPAAEREAWLASLPPDAAPLRERLARALAQQAAASEHRFDAPLLSPEAGSDGVAGERVGPWRLLHLLGRGGMGSVWAAERADGLYEREVALKLPQLARHPTLAARMAQERQIAARLEHPGIARLYDAGVDELGRPFLVMERVQGQGLLDFAREHALDSAACVRLVLQAADALAHAHRHLVVHRDVKPSNLMVTAEGQLKLLDFGVARLLTEDLSGTLPASATLSDSARTHTPRYAAPEQREGGPIGTATDLYALALVLHEVLTGSLPEPQPGAPEPAGGQPQASGRLAPALRAVLQRAWHADPARRQPSVAHFADELRAFLAHRVPDSWPASRSQRLRLWGRRHRTALGWSGLAAAGALAAFAALFVEQSRTREQQARLDQARIFLTTTFADIEPRAGQPAASVTGLELIESALQRAHEDLNLQPVLQAEVMGELAVMQRRFERPERALALLRQAHRQMVEHARPGDVGRHLVAAQLALEELAAWQRHGQEESLVQVATLANAVLDGCTAPGSRCAKARAFAHAALRNQAAALGEDERAQLAADRAVAESAAAFGAAHAETVMARVHHAMVLRNADRLDAADRTLQAARAAASAAGLRRGDAKELLMAQAMIDGDLGRSAPALSALDALAGTMGADSPDIALLQRLRAQALWTQGLLDEAVEACDRVLESATLHGNGWERLNALHLRTRALAAAGRWSEAGRSSALWDSQLAADPQAPDGVQALRRERGRAELALRSGRVQEAAALALALTSGPRLERPSSPLELAMNWDLRGAAARVAGAPAEAARAHEQAQTLYARLLPEAHPLRLRNRLEAARAAALATPGPAGELELRRAAQAYLDVLPAGSAWRRITEAWAAGSAAATTGLL